MVKAIGSPLDIYPSADPSRRGGGVKDEEKGERKETQEDKNNQKGHHHLLHKNPGGGRVLCLNKLRAITRRDPERIWIY